MKERLICVGWNCNGWGREKRRDKALLLSNTNASVILLNETWLHGEEQIEIDNYVLYGNNRDKLHTQVCVGSGGVAILVNRDILNDYMVTCVDSSYNSVLLIKLKHIKSETCIAFISCYVPPDNSRHGEEAESIFEYLIQLLYTYENCDVTYIFGDFNARLGEKSDYIHGIDEVPERRPIDTETNKQSELFLDFLTSMKL